MKSLNEKDSNEHQSLTVAGLAEDSEDLNPLRCWDCNLNFTSKPYLHQHLLDYHIKQPKVYLSRIQLPPLKITIKHRRGSSSNFHIVPSQYSPNSETVAEKLATDETEQMNDEEEEEEEENIVLKLVEEPIEEGNLSDVVQEENDEEETDKKVETTEVAVTEEEEEENVSFSSVLDEECENVEEQIIPKDTDVASTEDESIPPLEASPPLSSDGSNSSYPKIRIKTTGLLKESSKIREITDDDNVATTTNVNKNANTEIWNEQQDPLKITENDNILQLFNSNNERAKDLGFTTTNDSEFISLDRLDEQRNRNALQLYSANSNQNTANTLTSLTGLPMEALAQQVSRLQPPPGGGNSNGMHQQNVLINIQQFPQAPQPPPPPYQPPPMYHHPPPQPMYHPQPYQYPNMYYPHPPGPPGYPPRHMPPPPPPQQMPPNQPPAYHPSQAHHQMNGPPKPRPPRQMNANNQLNHHMPLNVNRQNGGGLVSVRQPTVVRQRQPVGRIGPRSVPISNLRNVRPKIHVMNNGQVRPNNVIGTVKRGINEQGNNSAGKKKRFDVLTPDKDDDDCQVICTQPKNSDGGLPQIQSVQGGTMESSSNLTSSSAESSIMHLSDSITLSVRNPQQRPKSPQKKSDAKAVANILATRGITVTATPKPKDTQQKTATVPPAVAAINLNGAVSIIPSSTSSASMKNNQKVNNASKEAKLPTVDLTDDTNAIQSTTKSNTQVPKNGIHQRQGLPFKCDLCPAQYPSALGLSKHRQNYHKTSGGMCEMGVPLINLKQPGIFQKLTSLGIYNYIPLPASSNNGTQDCTFAIPIINTKNPGNVQLLGSTTMLTLGPARNIPKPQVNNGNIKTNNSQTNRNN